MSTGCKKYFVYADVSAQSSRKKIRLSQLYVIDTEGEIIYDAGGDGTIGFYEGRITCNKLKEAVKSFVEWSLELVNLDVDIQFENISLRKSIELDQILLRTKSELHDHLREFR